MSFHAQMKRLANAVGREKKLLIGLALTIASMLIVFWVQMPSDRGIGGLRLFAGADCGEPYNLVTTYAPHKTGDLRAEIRFEQVGRDASQPRLIPTANCKTVRVVSSRPMSSLCVDPFMENCIDRLEQIVKQQRGGNNDYTLPREFLGSFHSVLFAQFNTALRHESFSEVTLATSVGGLGELNETASGHDRIIVKIDIPPRSATTLLMGAQTGSEENGRRLVFGPDARQPQTSLIATFDDRDRKNLAAIIALLASTVLGVGASIIASRFVDGA